MKAPCFAIACILLSLVLSLSCGQSFVNSGEDGITSFPLEVGNRWVYSQNDYHSGFGSGAQTDTVHSLFTRRVVDFDSILLPSGVYLIDDTIITTWSEYQTDTSVTRCWWSLTDDKLCECGRRSIVNPGDTIPSLWEYPRVLLDFPLERNKNWLMGESDLGDYNRRVVDIDNCEIHDTDYHCAVVKTSIEVLPNIEMLDWYSNSGLIRSHIDFGKSYLQDEMGNIIDSVYSYQSIVLEDIDLVN